MSSTLSFCLLAAIIAGVCVIVLSYKTGHFFKSIFLTAISGIGSLFAVNILTSLTGVSIAVNYITLALSGIFGIPGTIMLLFMH